MECSLFYVSILEMVAVVAESQVLLSSSSICLSEIYDKTKVNKRSFSRWLLRYLIARGWGSLGLFAGAHEPWRQLARCTVR